MSFNLRPRRPVATGNADEASSEPQQGVFHIKDGIIICVCMWWDRVDLLGDGTDPAV